MSPDFASIEIIAGGAKNTINKTNINRSVQTVKNSKYSVPCVHWTWKRTLKNYGVEEMTKKLGYKRYYLTQ